MTGPEPAFTASGMLRTRSVTVTMRWPDRALTQTGGLMLR